MARAFEHPAAVAGLVGLALTAFVVPAAAQEVFAPDEVEDATAEDAASYPRLEGEVSIEIQNDWVHDAENEGAELDDLFTTTESLLALYLSPNLSIQSGLVLEPVRDPAPGEDRAFEDHGLFVETLGLYYEAGAFSLYGGKYNPPFGTAWDLAPGIYGTEFAEDYELTERIGFGGTVSFGESGVGGAGFGAHTLSANTFFADTSVLSESALTDRGNLDKEDGGLSNTEDFSSFTLTLDGGDFPGLAALGYHLGFSHQAAGEGDGDDERGYVAGLNGTFGLTDETALFSILEYAHLDSAGGLDRDRDYLTAGAALLYGPWNLTASYTHRRTDPDGMADAFDDDLFQLSGGYAFAFGLTADIGYRYTEEEGEAAHTIGLLLTYGFDFALD